MHAVSGFQERAVCFVLLQGKFLGNRCPSSFVPPPWPCLQFGI